MFMLRQRSFYEASTRFWRGPVAYARCSSIEQYAGLKAGQRYLDVLYAMAFRDAQVRRRRIFACRRAELQEPKAAPFRREEGSAWMHAVSAWAGNMAR